MCRIYYGLIFLCATFALASCEKNYLDVGLTNPNQTAVPPLNSSIAYVTNRTSLNCFSAANATSYYVQYLASSSVAGLADTYDPSQNYSTLWANVYYVLENCKVLDSLAADKQAFTYMGIARIIKAYNLNLLNNLFGDIPYTDALNKQNITPKYDKAEEIYDTTLSLLDQGIALLKEPEQGLEVDASNDLIHGGSVSAWLKTAYALKARYLLEAKATSRYNAADILTALSEAYTSSADDAQETVFVQDDNGGTNPWNAVAEANAGLNLDGWLSANLVNAMNGTTYGVFDPRLPLITNLTKFGDYRGTVNGHGRVGTGTNNEESVLTLTGYYSGPTAALNLVSYSELLFIKAEVLFDQDKAAAYQAYLAGIKANMDKMGVASGDETAYLTNASVAVGPSNLTLSLIFKEKYIATFLNPEAWVDVRRFNYQYKDMKLPENANLTSFVQRVPYPSTETSRNSANVPDITSLADKLWWNQ